jgi:uncharacterized protein
MGLVTRILLLVAIALLAFFWIRKMLRAGDSSGKKPAQPAQSDQVGDRPQDLIACHHCGLHFPQADALLKDGRTYCCDDHAKAGPKTNN